MILEEESSDSLEEMSGEDRFEGTREEFPTTGIPPFFCVSFLS